MANIGETIRNCTSHLGGTIRNCMPNLGDTIQFFVMQGSRQESPITYQPNKPFANKFRQELLWVAFR